MKYKLEVSEKQLEVLSEALDLYSRIFIGQLEEIEYKTRSGEFKYKDPSHMSTNYEKIYSLIGELKYEIFSLDRHASYSICSDKANEKAKISNDIHNVIRHKLYKDRNEGKNEFGFSIYAHEPIKISKDEELPIIEKVE